MKELLIDKYLPEFIINDESEIILFPYKKFFRFSETKYTFNASNKNFMNDSELKKILLKDNLDKINIVKQNDILYVTVF